jgi:hypothetical protein
MCMMGVWVRICQRAPAARRLGGEAGVCHRIPEPAMDLTAEQFAEVLRSLGDSRHLAPSDKRRAERVTHRCRAAITLGNRVAAGRRVSVTVKDFSPRGICLVRAENMDRGSNFIISMGRRGGPPVYILCTVVHCQAVSKNMHTIGAEFTCIIDTALPRPDPANACPSQEDRIRSSMLD